MQHFVDAALMPWQTVNNTSIFPQPLLGCIMCAHILNLATVLAVFARLQVCSGVLLVPKILLVLSQSFGWTFVILISVMMLVAEQTDTTFLLLRRNVHCVFTCMVPGQCYPSV